MMASVSRDSEGILSLSLWEASVPCVETRAGANPVNKVIELLTDLETKIKGEGLEAHRDHEEFTA